MNNIKARKETQFLIELAKAFPNLKIECQKNCFNGTYRIDYLIDDKIAVEYDERHHKSQRKQDEIRQQEIEDQYGYVFIRVEEGHEAQGIIAIQNQIEAFDKLPNGINKLKYVKMCESLLARAKFISFLTLFVSGAIVGPIYQIEFMPVFLSSFVGSILIGYLTLWNCHSSIMYECKTINRRS